MIMNLIQMDNAREECGKLLKNMRTYLEAADLKRAETELLVSGAIIKRYLSGKVVNLSMGLTLLTHFRKLLERRLARLRFEAKKADAVTVKMALHQTKGKPENKN